MESWRREEDWKGVLGDVEEDLKGGLGDVESWRRVGRCGKLEKGKGLERSERKNELLEKKEGLGDVESCKPRKLISGLNCNYLRYDLFKNTLLSTRMFDFKKL